MNGPNMAELWHQAGGDGQKYRDLLHEHGYTLRPGDPGYGDAPRTLPCGWPGPGRESRCEVTELLVSQCGHCTGRTGDEGTGEKRDLGPWFGARYAGKCADCGERFGMQDRIRADGEGGYLCAGCGEQEEL